MTFLEACKLAIPGDELVLDGFHSIPVSHLAGETNVAFNVAVKYTPTALLSAEWRVLRKMDVRP